METTTEVEVIAPEANDYIISQGDTLPVMKITIPRNSDGQLVNLHGCDITFLGQPVGSIVNPPPIVRPIESYAVSGIGDKSSIVVSVRFKASDTKAIKVSPGETYQKMQGELEINDGHGGVLTVPTEDYIIWWIRGDIGDGA